jgi:excisionase family DNA binding protein
VSDAQPHLAQVVPIDPADHAAWLLRSRLALSPDEAALLMGISRDLVDNLIRTGQLHARKAGTRVVIGIDQIREYLAGGDAA